MLIIGGISLAIGFCLCLAIANFAPERFFDIFQKCNKIKVQSDFTTLQFIENFNENEFDSSLKVHQIDRLAGDAYVRGGDLLLSQTTLNDNGIASFATLAHELGHALQDRDTNKLKVKTILYRIGVIIGPLLFPSLIAGLVLLAFRGNLFYWGIGLLCFGAFIFILAVILKSLTISIEKDASKKALVMLEEYLTKKELKQAKKLLNSAKLTYWANLFQTLLGWTFLTRKSKLFG